jgi:ATP-dependent Clp protease ATP-binding subunit ClpA
LVDLEKPLVSMIFAGPTGVGKTETAKIIASKFVLANKH